MSCNPQYFGPLAGEFVTLFEVELTAQGNFNARKLLSRASDDIQRIDVWGINSKADEVFVEEGTNVVEVVDAMGTIVTRP